MALGATIRVGVDSGSGGSPKPSSVMSRWETVHGDATSESATPEDIESLTDDGLRWCRVPGGATRLLELRQRYDGALSSGATVSVIGCDRFDETTDLPHADAHYRTIASGIALGATDDVEYGGWVYTTPQSNSGSGWDLLGDAAFLVVVTTAASASGSVSIQGKITN